MPVSDQPLAKGPIVVYLAVENEGKRAILVEHGLFTPGNVDDAASLTIPSATEGVANAPLPSGPRCAISSRARSTSGESKPTKPTMPHTAPPQDN